MIRIRILATDEIRDVTPNVAHDLIDSGKASIYRGNREPGSKAFSSGSYANRQMRTGGITKKVVNK